MREVPIADIYKLGHKEILPSVRGVLIELVPMKQDKNSKGPWSIQKGVIRDSTGEIAVKFMNRFRELPQSLINREILISCKEGDRGMTGVYSYDDTYPGETSRIVEVTATALIDDADGRSSDDQPPANQNRGGQHQQPPTRTGTSQPAQSQPTKQATNKPASPAPATNGGAVGDVKRTLNRMANLYLHCLEAGSYVAGTYDSIHDAKMTDEQFQACVSSLFIQATRENLYRELPIGSF